jgi:hypothetical protein
MEASRSRRNLLFALTVIKSRGKKINGKIACMK